jgi:hypothetical protein
MKIENFMNFASQSNVIYRYLDLLAERTVALEQRVGVDEIRQLRRENRELRDQLVRLDRPAMESLLVFLPVIYRNFWGTVRPDELAQLAGLLEVPVIPSPCPEPSVATRLAMKKRFLQLPEQERASLIAFCRQLPYQLTVRAEMRALLEST